MEKTLGKRIMEHRKRLGLTQDALAERLGITAQAISKWENDLSCPDIATLPRLAEIFGISVDELLGREAFAKVHQAEVVDDAEHGLHLEHEDGKWEFHWDGGRKSALFFAIWVLLVGLIYLAAKWFTLDISFWEILWPSFLLVFGISDIFKSFSVFKLGIALFGGYYLVHNLGLWELDIAGELIFPICIVLFGISLLVDALRKPKKPRFTVTKHGGNSKKTNWDCHNDGSGFSCDLSFGERTFPVAVPVLHHGEADCSFGTLVVDLTGCQAVSENCHVAADCSFGELKILVPRRFAVQCTESSSFASISFNGHPDSEPSGIINLDADVSFGQIEVEYV